jgi:hypothetical protein
MLRAVFGFFLPTDPESIIGPLMVGLLEMLVGAHSHEGGTGAQRQVLGIIYLLMVENVLFWFFLNYSQT